jgi:hypothetical protein
MKRKPGSPAKQGLNIFSLRQLGVILIVAGITANLLASFTVPLPANSAEARGQASGRGLVTFVAVIAGLVLIVRHFARRKATVCHFGG